MDAVTLISKAVVFLFDDRSKVPLGTGFMVGYPVPEKPGAFVPLVVTAKHVVGSRGKIVVRYSPKYGPGVVNVPYDLGALRQAGDLWEHADDGVDIVVFRTTVIEGLDYTVVPKDVIASRGTYEQEDIKATDRVIFPCLLVNFMGGSRNYPVIRDGTIALIPDEEVPLEYTVSDVVIRTEQQVILVDAIAIPGASGSPLFLWPGPRLKGGSYNIGGGRPWLLGIMHAFYLAVPRDLIEAQTTDTVLGFQENSGVAIAFPSWRLLEILEWDELARRMDEVVQAGT